MALMQRRAMSPPPLKKIVVIGAGLAGAACAHAFANQGYRVTVYEKSVPASGASGVPIAMFAPSVSADDAWHSRVLRRGVNVLLRELHRLTRAGTLIDGVDWAMTGALERCGRSPKRLPSTWLEPQDPVGLQSMTAGAQLWHGVAGWVRPAQLIAAWLSHPNIRVVAHQHLHDASALGADITAVIVACGYQSAQLVPHISDDLQPIRGQVEWGLGSVDANIGYPINGMGHFIQTGSAWLLGATYQRDEVYLHADLVDRERNFEKLARLLPQLSVPSLAALRQQSTSWVGIRAAQKSRVPLLGKVNAVGHSNVWVCAGLGSRGLSLAALCAQQLCAAMEQNECYNRLALHPV